jgi:hydroxymethylglutaryl-CoA synthase
MGAEAALNASNHSGIDVFSDLDAIYLGTDSLPCIEHSSLGVIADVLRAKEEIDTADFTASPRASIAALKACQDAIKAGRVKYGMVIGAESRAVAPGSPEEINCGAGAAAVVMGTQDTIADIEETYTYSTSILDRWRGAGESYIKEYEPRFTRDYGYERHIIQAGKAILQKMGATIEDFQHVVVQQPDARMIKRATKAMNIHPDQIQHANLFGVLGDLGAASVMMGLAAVLDKAKPGERILMLSYGSGASDALSLRVNDRIEERRGKAKTVEQYLNSKIYIEDYVEFAQLKGTLKKDAPSIALGLPPASAALWRDGPDIRRLNAIKCTNCEYVNFPPSIRKICVRCGNTEFEKVNLSRKGLVHTYCLNIYLPPPLQSPLPLIIADLDDGNRYRALGTEIRGSEEIRVEMPVEIVLRNIITQDGVGVYGNVLRPIRNS